MSLKHLVRSLLVLLFLIGTCRVVRAQSCPGITQTPSGTEVNGDTSFPASTTATVVRVAHMAQAQARPTEDREALVRAQKATEAIVDKHRAHLMEIPHVDHVSACGTPEKEWAICVQVENHIYLSEVQRKIPSQIEGLPVRIEPRDQGWSL